MTMFKMRLVYMLGQRISQNLLTTFNNQNKGLRTLSVPTAKLLELSKTYKCLKTTTFALKHRHDFSVVKETASVDKEVDTVEDDKEAIQKNSKILMEFFDDPKNWPESEVKSGRAWKLDELRIKSNKDLHQLWFVLLKERNMLLTMEHECNEQMELFPSPERLDKVKLSMANLETVVRERNRAYHLLETGETGERPVRLVRTSIGLIRCYRSAEHVLPPFMNLKWLKSRNVSASNKRPVRKFLHLFNEKIYLGKRRLRQRNRNEVMMLLRRNPNINREMLMEKYPDVDIDILIRKDKTRGHYVPKIEF